MRFKLVTILLFLVSFSALAQYKQRNFRQRELGFLLGGSYYIGDINRFKHFAFSQPAGGIYFRYSPHYRYAWRFGLNYGRITASDSRSKNPDQLLRNASFRNDIFEAHVLSEFNFVEYRIGNSKHYFTMFIFAGLAGFYQNPNYPLYQVSIPFGIGFKHNVGDRMGIGIEWGPRKTFTDYLDDVSGLYPAKNNPYSNPSKEQINLAGSMRGNPRTKDWYFYYGLTLNFKLKGPREHCYGVGGKEYH